MQIHGLTEPIDQPRTYTEMHGTEAEDTPPDRVMLDSVADQARRWIVMNVFLGRKIPCGSVSVRGSIQRMALDQIPECRRITDV